MRYCPIDCPEQGGLIDGATTGHLVCEDVFISEFYACTPQSRIRLRYGNSAKKPTKGSCGNYRESDEACPFCVFFFRVAEADNGEDDCDTDND